MVELTFDSEEERLFHLYLEELKHRGFIDSFIFHPETITISEEADYGYVDKKNKCVVATLLRKHEYTPDFKVFWNIKAKGIFYNNINDIVNLKNKESFTGLRLNDFRFIIARIYPACFLFK
jgi:hypothetical protein